MIKTLLFSLLIIPLILSAQGFQGKAYYQTKMKVDMKLDNPEINDEQHAMIQNMLKKQFEKTFVLTFDQEASIYKEEEKLDNPTRSSGLQVEMVVIGGGGGDGVHYKNTKEKRYAKEQELMGKQFLIKDKLKPIEWKLEEDSKVIGKYLCFKATSTRKVRKSTSMSFGTDKDSATKESKEPEEVTEIITAWYTTDIPVNHGPDVYWGLPGLIMELNVGDMQYVCNKIVMNSKDKIAITEPVRGKEISQEKYRTIMEKKMKEMDASRGRESQGGFKIEID